MVLESTLQQNPQVISSEKEEAYTEESKTYPTQHAADLDQFVSFMEGGYRSVYFIDQTLKGANLRKFTESILKARGTEDLFIWNNGLGTDGMKQMNDALRFNSALQKLYIAKNDISPSGAQYVAAFLKTNNSLTELSLKANKIEDKGVAAIAKSLEVNNGLRRLDLTFCGFGENGVKALSQSLTINTALKGLVMYKNNISDNGCVHLGNMLKDNFSLVRLDVKENKITDKGLGALATGLAGNSGLNELYLDKNTFTADGLTALEDGVNRNETIMRIQFGAGVTINEEIQGRIDTLLKRNKSAQEDAYLRKLKDSAKAPWRRSKLMVVGEGGAGKTATVRSLLNKAFDENWDSTVGVSITETNAHDVWKADNKTGFAATIASRLAALVMEENRKKEKSEAEKRQAKAKANAGGAVEEVVIEDVPEEEVVVEEVPVEEPKAKEETGGAPGGLHQNHVLDDGINIDDIGDEDLNELFPYDATMVAKGRSEGEGVRMAIWDYGGQEVFYTLHHLFLTKYGVYLLVFDMTKVLAQEKEPMEFIRFWLNSIRFHASSAPILMIGTFADKLKDPNDVEKVEKIIGELTKKYKQVERNEEESNLSFFPINNKDAQGIVQLRRTIEAVTVKQDFVELEVSIQWMRALDKVLEEKVSWVNLSSMKAIGKKIGIDSATEIDEMLKLFHELGVILHFTATVNLSEVVTTNPQWLVDAISMVIRDETLHPFDKTQFTKAGLDKDIKDLFANGFASRDLLDMMWPKNQVDFLIDLMRKLLLLSSWRFGDERESTYLVPSMIQNTTKLETPGTIAKFAFEFLPIGVFERLVCLAVDYSSSQESSPLPKLSKQASVVFFGKDTSVGMQRKGDTIEVTVENEGECTRVLDILLAMMRKLNEEVMNGSVSAEITLQDEGGNYVELKKARTDKIAPWYAHKKPAPITANFDAFLESF